MKEQEFYIPSSDGKSRLHVVAVLPDGEVRALLQISHGMIEHILRYREAAMYFAEHGIAVIGHDHLGHGKTAPDADHLGYFAEKDGDQYLIKDLRRVMTVFRKHYPGKPYFLLGHSMGSFIVRRFLTVYNEGPDGVIIMGTGGQPAALVASGYVLASFICHAMGDMTRSRLLDRLSLGSYNKKFHPAETKHDWLTREKDRVLKYEGDPYCRFSFTAGAYRDLFRMILLLTRKEKKGRMENDMPFLFISGSDDPVGDYKKGVMRVIKRYEKAGTEDLTTGFYEGARHELLNERNRDEVLFDILTFLEKNI